MQFGHIGHAQRCVAVQVGVGYLSIVDTCVLVQCQAHTPQGRAFGLGQSAVGIYHGTAVDAVIEVCDDNFSSVRVDFYPGDTGDPCGHITFLAETGGHAHALVFCQCFTPARLGFYLLQHMGQALRPADAVGCRAGVFPGTIEQGQAKFNGIPAGAVRHFVHKGFRTPGDPTGTHGPQPAGKERFLGQIIIDRTHTMVGDGVPVVGAVDGKPIHLARAIHTGSYKPGRHGKGRPAGSGGMINTGQLPVVIKTGPET